MLAASTPDPACAGCMGNGRCWVRLGTGRLRHPDGPLQPCHVCRGSGRCAKCQHVVDLTVGTHGRGPAHAALPVGP